MRWGLLVIPAAVATLLWTGTPALAVDLRFNPSLLGQVRRSFTDDQTETPTELYGDFGLSGLPHGTTFDTYFRLEEDFSDLSSETDFFAGVMRIPAAAPGLDLQLGRQIVAESPIGLWDADSGQIRLGIPQTPYSMTLFGGQPRYWEPTYGPPSLSQNEQIFGTSLRVAQFRSGALSLGYLQQIRDGRALMQQVTLSGTRSFATLPGAPRAYGNFAFDADGANIDQIRVGTQSFVGLPQLLMNVEAGYYKPQDQGNTVVTDIDRREDAIFQLFSVSELLQFRGGMRYGLTPTISTFVDLSYQRYQEIADSYVNGYVWTTGRPGRCSCPAATGSRWCGSSTTAPTAAAASSTADASTTRTACTRTSCFAPSATSRTTTRSPTRTGSRSAAWSVSGTRSRPDSWPR